MLSLVAANDGKLSKVILQSTDNVSYSVLMRLLRTKSVKVNGVRVNGDVKVNKGDCVDLYYTPTSSINYRVVYSDENVVVIDKPSGYTSESIYECLKKQYPSVGFIHRLDRNTSGIMIFSLTPVAEKELIDGFRRRVFEKIYLTEVKGVPEKLEGVLKDYLVKDAASATVSVYKNKAPNSVSIATEYKVLEIRNDSSLLEVRLITGKTHQIRAHLAFYGHPIVGDGKYGDNRFNKEKGVKSQRLKAVKLKLNFKKSYALYYLDGKTFTAEADFI